MATPHSNKKEYVFDRKEVLYILAHKPKGALH